MKEMWQVGAVEGLTNMVRRRSRKGYESCSRVKDASRGWHLGIMASVTKTRGRVDSNEQLGRCSFALGWHQGGFSATHCLAGPVRMFYRSRSKTWCLTRARSEPARKSRT